MSSHIQPHSEKELLQQLDRFEESALAEVFDAYYQPLYRYIYHHVREVRTAEDLTAEVFARLLERLKAKRGPSKHVRAWLYRVAYNLCVDHTRRSIHRNHAPLDEQMSTSGREVADQVQDHLLFKHIEDALGKLSPRQRSVIILKFLEGMQNGEIAVITGLSIAAVKALQHRGLAKVRSHLIASGVWKGAGE